MEQMLETIDLDVEESNELLFKVKVEGLDQAPTKIRLVCEAGDVAFMFNGQPTGDDVVQFTLPILKDKLKEGVYHSKVEVLIENRYFAPVEFNINFKKAVRVVAEAIRMPTRHVQPQVKVTASPIVVKKPAAPPVQAPVKQTQASSTLKERYVAKPIREVVETIDDADEGLIRELARTFIRGKK